MTAKKAHGKTKDDHHKEKGGNHRIRHFLMGAAVLAAVGFGLPFVVNRDSLPGAVKDNKIVAAYYNRTHGLMHRADEKIDAKIDELHKAAQGVNASPAKDNNDTKNQTGYTRTDREKLDELITKGAPAP